MVKFLVQDSKDGVPLLGFGISEKNVEMLKEGKPILIKGKEEMKIPMNFMIFYGEDERHMYNTLEDFIGPKTEFKSNGTK